MILTVTLNAALDTTYDVDELVPHASNRVTTVRQRAGGKGVNVASVLARMGHPVIATGCVGGRTGADIRADLDARGVAHRFVGRRAGLAPYGHGRLGGARRRHRPQRARPGGPGAGSGRRSWPGWPSSCANSAPVWWSSRAACRGVCPPTRTPGWSPPPTPTAPGSSSTPRGRRCGTRSRPGRRSSSPTGTSCCRPPAAPTSPTAVTALRALGARDVVVSDGAEGVLLFPSGGRPLRARLREPLSGNPTGAGDALVAALAVRPRGGRRLAVTRGEGGGLVGRGGAAAGGRGNRPR